MKKTLLEMVQSVLTSMESDQVNSISDTIESNAVAHLIRDLYYDIANDLGLPEHESLIELNASLSADQPVLMHMPNNVGRVSSISYDIRGENEDDVDLPNWRRLTYVPLDRFIEITQGYRSNSQDVGSMEVTAGGDTFEFIHKTNAMPTYFTSFDDDQILFDSYNELIDTTLQKSKTLCYGSRISAFTLEDSFVPDLDATQFPYFLNRAKVRAFAEFKQQQHQEAAGEARRQKIVTQKRGRKTPDQSPLQKRNNYGR